MTPETVYLKDQTFIPDFIRIYSSANGSAVSFCNDESDSTSYMLRCKRKFDSSDFNIEAGESVQMIFPATGRFEITNPNIGLMKCIVEVIEPESESEKTYANVAGTDSSFVKNVIDEDSDAADGSNSFASSIDGNDESSGSNVRDEEDENSEEWHRVRYYLSKDRRKPAASCTATATTTPSLSDLFEHEDIQGLLSVDPPTSRVNASSGSLFASDGSNEKNHKSTPTHFVARQATKRPKKRSIRYSSGRGRQGGGRGSSESDISDDSFVSDGSDDDDGDFHRQRAQLRQASQSHTSQHEELEEVRVRLSEMADKPSAKSEDENEDGDCGHAPSSRCLSFEEVPSHSSPQLPSQLTHRHRRFSPPAVNHTLFHYTTFTSESSPHRKQRQNQAYTSFINPYESRPSMHSPSGIGVKGKIRRRHRERHGHGHGKQKGKYQIVHNQLLYAAPTVADQSVSHHRPADIEVVVISDYDFSHRNIVIHVNTAVEFRLHPHDVPLHVEHVLEGRSMQEELCFVSPILQHPFSRVFQIVPSCPGEIYVRCQIYTDMACRITVLPLYYKTGYLLGNGMANDASSRTSPSRSVLCRPGSGSSSTDSRTANPSSTTIPPPTLLHSSLRGVAEVHSSYRVPSSLGSPSRGDVSDSVSCYSFSTAMDSDDATVRTGYSSASTTPMNSSRRVNHSVFFSEEDQASPPPPPLENMNSFWRDDHNNLQDNKVESDEPYPQHYVVPWHSNKTSPGMLNWGEGGVAYYDAEEEDGGDDDGHGDRNVLSSSGDPSAQEGDLAGTVLVEDFRFQPTHLTIEQGRSVRFVSVSHASVHKLTCNSSSSSSQNSPASSPDKSGNGHIHLTEFDNRTLESSSSSGKEFLHTFNSLGTYVVVNEIFSFMSCEITVVLRAVPLPVPPPVLAEQSGVNQRDPVYIHNPQVNDILYSLAHSNFDGYSNSGGNEACATTTPTSPTSKFHRYAADESEGVSSSCEVSSMDSSPDSTTENIENECPLSFNGEQHLFQQQQQQQQMQHRGGGEKNVMDVERKSRTGSVRRSGRKKQSGCTSNNEVASLLLQHQQCQVQLDCEEGQELEARTKERDLFFSHQQGRPPPHHTQNSTAGISTTAVVTTTTTTTITSVTTTSPPVMVSHGSGMGQQHQALSCHIPMLGSFVSSPGTVSAAIAAAGSLERFDATGENLGHCRNYTPGLFDEAPSDLMRVHTSPPKAQAQQKAIAAGADLTEELDDSDDHCDSTENRAQLMTSKDNSEDVVEVEMKEQVERSILETHAQTNIHFDTDHVSGSVVDREDDFDGEATGKVLSEKALQRRRRKNQRKKKNARLRTQSQDFELLESEGNDCGNSPQKPGYDHLECIEQSIGKKIVGDEASELADPEMAETGHDSDHTRNVVNDGDLVAPSARGKEGHTTSTGDTAFITDAAKNVLLSDELIDTVTDAVTHLEINTIGDVVCGDFCEEFDMWEEFPAAAMDEVALFEKKLSKREKKLHLMAQRKEQQPQQKQKKHQPEKVMSSTNKQEEIEEHNSRFDQPVRRPSSQQQQGGQAQPQEDKLGEPMKKTVEENLDDQQRQREDFRREESGRVDVRKPTEKEGGKNQKEDHREKGRQQLHPQRKVEEQKKSVEERQRKLLVETQQAQQKEQSQQKSSNKKKKSRKCEEGSRRRGGLNEPTDIHMSSETMLNEASPPPDLAATSKGPIDRIFMRSPPPSNSGKDDGNRLLDLLKTGVTAVAHPKKGMSNVYDCYQTMPEEKEVEQKINFFFSQRMEHVSSLASDGLKDTLPSGTQVPVIRIRL